jgi:hypothetical protein
MLPSEADNSNGTKPHGPSRIRPCPPHPAVSPRGCSSPGLPDPGAIGGDKSRIPACQIEGLGPNADKICALPDLGIETCRTEQVSTQLYSSSSISRKRSGPDALRITLTLTLLLTIGPITSSIASPRPSTCKCWSATATSR